MRKKEKGFTLIETLVVIAMIGILSSVVLYSLKPSEKKAKDTKIISYLNELRSISSSYYDPLKGEYDSGFKDSSISDVEKVWSELKKLSINCGAFLCGNNTSEHMTITKCPSSGKTGNIPVIRKMLFGAKLVSQDKFYCIDTSGNSKIVDNISGFYNKCVCE
jgi:prepilin-type N-terminal cleavage/methylation domain-containing protein